MDAIQLGTVLHSDEACPDDPELAGDGFRGSINRAPEVQIEKRHAALLSGVF